MVVGIFIRVEESLLLFLANRPIVMRKALLLACFAVCLVINLSAQVLGTPVATWNFSGGLPAGWSTGSDSGIASWEYRGPSTNPSSAIGPRGSCAGSFGPLESLTGNGGFMIFDSNYWDDQGAVCGGALGSGPDPAPQDAWLTTNSVNLTSYSGAVVTFQQNYWHFQASTSVQLSTDNGATWVTIYSNPEFISASVEWVNINISALAGGQSNVRLRFLFSGFYYWWMIDDVTIFVPNDNDLLLTSPRYTNTGSNPDDQSRDLMYDQYPISNRSILNFGGTINNIGTSLQNNATLNVRVKNQAGTTVYNQTSPASSIGAGISLPVSLNSTYTPPGALGNYTVEYSVAQTQTDNNLQNNKDTLDFSVTSYTMARDEGPVVDAFIPASAFSGSRLRIGNYFEAFTGGNAMYSVTAALAEGTEVGSVVKGYIYTPTLDSLIAESFPYTVNLYDINAVGQERMITVDFETPIEMLNDSIYLVMIGSTDPNAPLHVGRNGASPDQTSFVNFTDNFDWYYLLRTPIVRVNVFPTGTAAGCTDPTAMNFETNAAVNDGSCRYPGCTFPGASNFNPSANWYDGSCILNGCDDPLAVNYNPYVSTNDGSCIYSTVGCTDPSAANYNPTAITDDGSCLYPGCTDPAANNFDPQANQNDGSCTYDVFGCTDPLADNYNSNANIDNGSCLYLGCTNEAAFNYDPNANADDGSCIFTGCTDENAANFNPDATQDDGSCIYPGCVDVDAINFDPGANTDDGSCIYAGCTNPVAVNYDSNADIDDGSCIIIGCTDPTATNYNADANQDSGNCIYGDILGCTDNAAVNYDPFATIDNGTCQYAGCTNPAAVNYDPNADIDNGSCIIPGCTLASALNYNPIATQNDGSCILPGCTNPSAINFNADADVDDGSCVVPGCLDPEANNYDPQATVSNNTCTYDPIQAEISVSATEGCAPMSLQIEVLNEISALGSCLLQLSNGFTLNSCQSVYSVTLVEPGTYTITYSYSQYGQTTSTTAQVVVNVPPATPVVSFNDSEAEVYCSNCGSNSVTWSTDGIIWPVNNDTLSIWSNGTFNNGEYVATSINEFGCERSSGLLRVVKPYFVADNDSALCAPFGVVFTNLTDPVPGISCVLQGPDESYDLAPGESVLVPYLSSGDYTATMSASWLTSSGTYSLPIHIGSIPLPQLAQLGNTVVCTNFDATWQLDWQADGQDIGFDNETVLPIEFSSYTASFISGTCISTNTLTVIGVGEFNPGAQVKLYPNPTGGVLTVEWPRAVAQWRITDAFGRTVLDGKEVFGDHLQLDLSQLSGGLYQLTIQTPTFVKAMPFVVQR